MSPDSTRSLALKNRFPRVSGDEPDNGTVGWDIKWFSPRERG